MARIAKPPVPIGMYRHFAVATLAITFALAMFADGENRDAMAQELQQQRQQAELQRASAAKFAPRKLALKPSTHTTAASTGFGDDVSMGSPSAPGSITNGSGNVAATPSAPGAAGTSIAAARSFGIPAAQLAAMSAAERDQMVKGLRAAGVLSPAERRRRTAALLATSRVSSGSSEASTAAGGD